MSDSHKCAKLWTQRDGVKIRICDMRDRHLLNTLALLRKHHQHELRAMEGMLAMLTGDMAQFCMEGEIDAAEVYESRHPLYDDLYEEAVRRGIYSG